MSTLKQRKPTQAAAHDSAAAAVSSTVRRGQTAVGAEDSIFSSNASKRRGEIFFLTWGAAWISLMAYIVATRWFEDFTPMHYMVTGIVIALPPIVLPFLFPGEDAAIPWHQRYTTKANVWIFILSWMANYFWTHYFYHVLGTSYTFDAWRLNDVPFALFLITHSYFHFYHVLSNIVLRWTWRQFRNRTHVGSVLVVTFVILVISFAVAFMETFTIQNFPYYVIPDRWAMYVHGSMFYALYFIVSFPMFFRMDETPATCWSLSYAAIDAFAASMLITQLLDFWRISIGPIVDLNLARQSALDATPEHLKGRIRPPSRENGVPFV